jgi:hypothetical protein
MTSEIIKYFAKDLLKNHTFFQILVILNNLSDAENVLECYGQDILIQILDFYTKKQINIIGSDNIDFFENVNSKLNNMSKSEIINNILLASRQLHIKTTPMSTLKYFIKKLTLNTSFIDIFVILLNFNDIDKKIILREFDDIQLFTLLYYFRKNYDGASTEHFYDILKIEREDLYEQILNALKNSNLKTKIEEDEINKMFGKITIDGVHF